jgi:hypothetical protein
MTWQSSSAAWRICSVCILMMSFLNDYAFFLLVLDHLVLAVSSDHNWSINGYLVVTDSHYITAL